MFDKIQQKDDESNFKSAFWVSLKLFGKFIAEIIEELFVKQSLLILSLG